MWIINVFNTNYILTSFPSSNYLLTKVEEGNAHSEEEHAENPTLSSKPLRMLNQRWENARTKFQEAKLILTPMLNPFEC